jgi:hypothetical protein
MTPLGQLPQTAEPPRALAISSGTGGLAGVISSASVGRAPVQAVSQPNGNVLLIEPSNPWPSGFREVGGFRCCGPVVRYIEVHSMNMKASMACPQSRVSFGVLLDGIAMVGRRCHAYGVSMVTSSGLEGRLRIGQRKPFLAPAGCVRLKSVRFVSSPILTKILPSHPGPPAPDRSHQLALRRRAILIPPHCSGRAHKRSRSAIAVQRRWPVCPQQRHVANQLPLARTWASITLPRGCARR